MMQSMAAFMQQQQQQQQQQAYWIVNMAMLLVNMAAPIEYAMSLANQLGTFGGDHDPIINISDA